MISLLKTIEATAQIAVQGGDKRPGAVTVYVEPWHRDIFGFLQMKSSSGSESEKAKSLFYALWIPDLL